jgi:DNA helicase-2/ATP-dependent DNA helicase PcrA
MAALALASPTRSARNASSRASPQTRYVVECVLENREDGATLKQQAILFRASHHSGPLEVELTRRNIPFVKFGGLKFLEAAHIKDMLALLRFVENPRDRIAGFRVLQLMPGVGSASAQRVLDHMMEAADPIRAIVDGTAPADLTVTGLAKALPYSWAEQERTIGLSWIEQEQSVGLSL